MAYATLPGDNDNEQFHKRRPGVAGWLLMAPLLTWLLAFVVAPTLIMLVYSFCQRNELGQVVFRFRDEAGRFTAFDNYLRIFEPAYFKLFGKAVLWGIPTAIVGGLVGWGWHVREYGPLGIHRTVKRFAFWAFWIGAVIAFDRQIAGIESGATYLRIFWRSIVYAAWTTLICILIGYPVAYFIGRQTEANRNRLLMVVMIPFWTSFLIRTYAWITILKTYGLLNAFLGASGMQTLVVKGYEIWGWLTGTPIDTDWDGRMSLLYTPSAVMIGLVYSYLPFMILPIYGSVEKLENALVEAAFDLGAGPVRAFSSVIIPLTRPGIVAGILLVFIPSIGMFAIQSLLGGGQVPMIGDVIANQFTKARDWPFGAALGITLLVMFIIAYTFSSRKKPLV